MYTTVQIYKNALKESHHPLNWELEHWYWQKQDKTRWHRFRQWKERCTKKGLMKESNADQNIQQCKNNK